MKCSKCGLCEEGKMASCETCGREIKNYGNENGGIRCANYCRSALAKPKRGRLLQEKTRRKKAKQQ